MISKTVDISLSDEDLVHEIKLCRGLDLLQIFQALSQTMTDDVLMALQDFVGEDKFATLVVAADTFAQRVRAVATPVDVPGEET